MIAAGVTLSVSLSAFLSVQANPVLVVAGGLQAAPAVHPVNTVPQGKGVLFFQSFLQESHDRLSLY